MIIDSVNILEYVFTTSQGSMAPPHDHGVVAVVDGQIVKVTPFRAANIPPPMALHEISVHSNVLDVAFNADASEIAVLHQQGISIFEWKNLSASSPAPELTGRYTFEKIESSEGNFLQISFSENSDVLVLNRHGPDSAIIRYGFEEDTGRLERKIDTKGPASSIATLSSFVENGVIHSFVQDKSGGLHSLLFGDHSLSHCNLPMQLPWIQIISKGEWQIAFGMSSNGYLYANSRLLAKNCTSFLVTPAHLIFTTTMHLIKFVHLTDVNGMYLCPESCFSLTL